MHHDHSCPCCRKKYIVRIHRKWWMRVFIFSKCFYCRMCYHVFITLFGFIVIDLGMKPKLIIS